MALPSLLLLWAHMRQGYCPTLGALHLGRTLAAQRCGSSQWLSQNCGHQWHLWPVLPPSLSLQAGTLCYPKSCWLSAEWNDRGSEESPQGWLMTFQPSRTSLGDPNLPSPTAFMGFLCFFASSARKDQAGTLCLLAGHGGGGVSGVEELYCHTQHEPGVAGTLHYYEGDCSEAQMAQRDCEYYSTEGNTSPNTPKHENNSTYYCDSNTASTLRHFGSERSDLT